MNELARDVRLFWEQQGLLRKTVSRDEIQNAERRLGRFPEDYRTFLLEAGINVEPGTAWIRFWSPDELRRTSQVVENDSTYSIIIADYMDESWWYTLELPFGRVRLSSGLHESKQLAGMSLSDFVSKYINNFQSLVLSAWPRNMS